MSYFAAGVDLQGADTGLGVVAQCCHSSLAALGLGELYQSGSVAPLIDGGQNPAGSDPCSLTYGFARRRDIAITKSSTATIAMRIQMRRSNAPLGSVSPAQLATATSSPRMRIVNLISG